MIFTTLDFKQIDMDEVFRNIPLCKLFLVDKVLSGSTQLNISYDELMFLIASYRDAGDMQASILFRMGMPENTFSYPVEYIKARLKEDWVTHNPEILKQNPYYGLICLKDVYHELAFPPRPKNHKQLLFRSIVPFKSSYENCINKLNEVFPEQLKGRICLAGGSIISLLFGNAPNDYDFFFTGISSDEEAKQVIMQYHDFMYPKENNYYSYRCSGMAYRTKNAISIGNRQFVLRADEAKSPAKIIYGFDIGSCKILYDREEIWMTPECYISLLNRCNYLNFDNFSTTYEIRMAKYYHRNFSIWFPNFNWDKYYGIPTNFHMGIKYVSFDESEDALKLKYYSDLLNLEKKYDKRGLHLYSLLKLNGIDMLLFLCERERKIRITDYSVEASMKSIRGYNGKFYINYSAETKGVFAIESEIEKVLQIPDEIYSMIQNILLSKSLELKWINAQEQINGSFHKLVIDNPYIWYNGIFYGDSDDKLRNILTHVTQNEMRMVSPPSIMALLPSLSPVPTLQPSENQSRFGSVPNVSGNKRQFEDSPDFDMSDSFLPEFNRNVRKHFETNKF